MERYSYLICTKGKSTETGLASNLTTHPCLGPLASVFFCCLEPQVTLSDIQKKGWEGVVTRTGGLICVSCFQCCLAVRAATCNEDNSSKLPLPPAHGGVLFVNCRNCIRSISSPQLSCQCGSVAGTFTRAGAPGAFALGNGHAAAAAALQTWQTESYKQPHSVGFDGGCCCIYGAGSWAGGDTIRIITVILLWFLPALPSSQVPYFFNFSFCTFFPI